MNTRGTVLRKSEFQTIVIKSWLVSSWNVNTIYLFPTNSLYFYAFWITILTTNEFWGTYFLFWIKGLTVNEYLPNEGPDKIFWLFFDIQLLLKNDNWGLVFNSWNINIYLFPTMYFLFILNHVYLQRGQVPIL